MPVEKGIGVIDRLQKCRELMGDRDLQAFLVSDLENVRYLTGFTGSAGVCLITPDAGYFVTDGRYILQASTEVSSLEIRIDKDPPPARLGEILKDLSVPVGFESDHVSVSQLGKWKEISMSDLVPVSGLVEDMRLVKDAGEIDLIRQAVAIVDAVFEQILGILNPGLTEKEVALEIDFRMRRGGADKEGFDTIVASGPHSAWPHAHPTDRVLAEGDFVKMDFGAFARGYNSDITRTVVLGKPTERQQAIYAAVLNAQLKALDAIRPGVKGQEVDAVARESIAAAGFGDYFTHNLGHSLGRSVHDGPALGRTVERELAPGMVVTVEPGIYVEGLGGVRIEDDVVVTEGGCDILTRSPKELLSV